MRPITSVVLLAFCAALQAQSLNTSQTTLDSSGAEITEEDLTPPPAPLSTPTESETNTTEADLSVPPPQQQEETIGETRQSAKTASNSSEVTKQLQYTRQMSKRGAVQHVVGTILEFGVAIPISLSMQGSTGPEVLFPAAISLVASGFRISGPIRNGVAASMTYDCSKRNDLGLPKNTNWGLYKGGWGLNAASALVNGIIAMISSGISSQEELDEAIATLSVLSLLKMSLSLGAEGLFIASSASASNYTKNALEKHYSGELSILPTYARKQGANEVGLKVRYLF